MTAMRFGLPVVLQDELRDGRPGVLHQGERRHAKAFAA